MDRVAGGWHANQAHPVGNWDNGRNNSKQWRKMAERSMIVVIAVVIVPRYATLWLPYGTSEFQDLLDRMGMVFNR